MTIIGVDVLLVYEGEVAFVSDDAAKPRDLVDVYTSHIHEEDDSFPSDADCENAEESDVTIQQCDAIDITNDADINLFIGAYLRSKKKQGMQL